MTVLSKLYNQYSSLILCILSSWVILGAIPYLSLGGIWAQVDTQIVILHGSCSILYFFQFVKFVFFKEDINKINTPLFFLPILLALLGIISALTNDNFYITLFGSGQIGQGVFWYFDLAIMTYFFSNILNSRLNRIIVFINFLFLTLITTIFTINPYWKSIPISFFYFNDYLCFFGVLTFILLTTLTKNKIFLLSGYLILGVYLNQLDNNAAMLLWLATLLLTTFIQILNFFKNISVLNKIKSFVISDFILTFSVVFLSILILGSSLYFWQGEGQISSNLTSQPLGSLIVRGKISEIAILNLLEFKSFFTGVGWGRVNDLLLAKMSTWQYDQLTVGFNLHFHTHNELFEHFVSLGLFGVILFLTYVYSIFKFSNHYGIFTKLGFLLLFHISCFWFFWAGTLPLMAITLASISKSRYKTSNLLRYRYSKHVIQMFFLLVSIFLLFGSWMVYSYTQNYKKITFEEINNLVKGQKVTDIKCSGFYDDKRGGFTVTPFVNRFPSYVIANDLLSDEQYLKVIEGVQCIADELIKNNKANLYLISAAILLDSKIYFSEDKDAKALFNSEKKYDKFKNRVITLMNKAPDRGDLIIPFLALAIEKKNYADAQIFCDNKKIKGLSSVCDFIYAINILQKPNFKTEDIRKSMQLLKSAKEKGIFEEKVYGWWMLLREKDIKGYSDASNSYKGDFGVPVSADIIYLISNQEVENITRLLNNYN